MSQILTLIIKVNKPLTISVNLSLTLIVKVNTPLIHPSLTLIVKVNARYPLRGTALTMFVNHEN